MVHDTELAALRRHPEYYIPGGDLFFLIENYHFRVHRYFFDRESTYFQASLAAPAAPGEQANGTSESSALVFAWAKRIDFERFLWVFYNPTYSLYHATVDEWTSILDLASRWIFPRVTELAIRELEKIDMDDIDRIVLYHKYDIDKKILIPRYTSLCSRSKPLTTDEGVKLGIETSLLIARARECARSKAADNGINSPLPDDYKKSDMESLITDLFVPQEPPASSSAQTPYLTVDVNGSTSHIHPQPSTKKGKKKANANANGAPTTDADAQ